MCSFTSLNSSLFSFHCSTQCSLLFSYHCFPFSNLHIYILHFITYTTISSLSSWYSFLVLHLQSLIDSVCIINVVSFLFLKHWFTFTRIVFNQFYLDLFCSSQVCIHQAVKQYLQVSYWFFNIDYNFAYALLYTLTRTFTPTLFVFHDQFIIIICTPLSFYETIMSKKQVIIELNMPLK